MMDSLLIEHVLTNLLENAIRYSPPASPIGVLARQEGRSIRIEVHDRGPGIPVGDELRIFEKFYRKGSGPVENAGVGIGLSICDSIVQLHRGRIWAENRPGGGAKLVFTLPIELDAAE